jgi:hypothetical protein
MGQGTVNGRRFFKFAVLAVLALLASLLVAPRARAASAAERDEKPDLPNCYQTRFYDIYTDVDRDLALDIGRQMDAMYTEYQRRLARFPMDRSGARLAAYLFQRQSDYLAYVGPAGRNTGGVFMPRQQALAAFVDNQGLSSLRRTLRHEAFHQFAYLVFEMKLPIWINEGMAQVFEEGIWTGQDFLLGQVPPRRVRHLKSDLACIDNRGLIPFTQLMAFTPERWAKVLNTDERQAMTEYNQSWAMVHFLVHARDAAGREKFRGMFLDMLDLIRDGKSGEDAFAGAFAGGNVKGFQDRFVEYARDLQPTAAASLIERQEVLGDFLIELKKKGRTYKQVSDFRKDCVRGRMSMTYFGDHGLGWQTDPNVEIYFCDVNDRPMGDSEMYFNESTSAYNSPLPDLICRGGERFQLRTRFYVGPTNRIEHEVMIEQPGR